MCPSSLALICYGMDVAYSLVLFSSKKGLHVGRHDCDHCNLTMGLEMEILLLAAKKTIKNRSQLYPI